MKNPEGQKVWQMIAESGVKRRFVAQRVGISYGYLNQLSYSERTIPAAVKAKFAAYFGTTVEELFPA